MKFIGPRETLNRKKKGVYFILNRQSQIVYEKFPTRLCPSLLSLSIAMPLINLLNLLTSELRKTLGNIIPGLLAISERLDGLEDIVLAGTDLLGGVTVAQGKGIVLDGLEVNGDTEGGTQLIVTSVTLANAGGRVIHASGDTETAQLGGQAQGQRLEGGVGREGDQ